MSIITNARWGGVASKIMLGITSTILASTLTLPILATQAGNAYADNTANTNTTLKISDDVQLSVTAPTVINYKLEPDGTFICPTDATIKNNSSIPIATKSWTTNIHAGTATSKDDFANSIANNAWWNTVSANGGEPSPFNLDTETLYDSWNMAASGMNLPSGNDDTLSLTLSGAMKNIDGTVNMNTGKQIANVTMTFATVLNKGKEPIAFAVYSTDKYGCGELSFYKRTKIPTEGEQFEGKTVTYVYEGIETAKYENYIDVPWNRVNSVGNNIYKVNIVDNISVVSGRWLFAGLPCIETIDVSKLDVSRCNDLYYMFGDDESLISITGLGYFDTSNITSFASMFCNCKNITEINGIECWDTSSAKNMSNMFHGATYYVDREYPLTLNWNVSHVENMDYLFCDSGFLSLDLSSWDTSHLPSMTNLFTDSPNMENGSMKYLRISSKWVWNGETSYPLAPDYRFVTDADGLWYSLSDGIGYKYNKIPSYRADTYYGSKALRDAAASMYK